MFHGWFSSTKGGVEATRSNPSERWDQRDQRKCPFSIFQCGFGSVPELYWSFSQNSAEISTATRLKSIEYHQAGYNGWTSEHRNLDSGLVQPDTPEKHSITHPLYHQVLTAIWDLLTKLCVIYPRFARDAPFCRCMSLQERIFPSQIDHLFHERQGWPRQNVIHRMVLPAISWSMSPWKTTVVITMNRS